MLYHLTVDASNNPARKLVHGFGNPILAEVSSIPSKKAHHFAAAGSSETIGGSWLTTVWTRSGYWVRTSSATIAPELLPKTVTGLSVRCYGLAPDIIGIGRKPVIIVLRSIERASGKTAANVQ
jgi:hypothetical protein